MSRVAPAALLAAVLLTGWAAAPAAAQLVAPDSPLIEISTRRFDIYFPPEREEEARRLASFADEALEGLAARFPGAAAGRRYPVLVADESYSPNGLYSSWPSDRIVLIPAPPALGGRLGSLDDPLRSVFVHELAHALSFSGRSPFWNLASAIFGDPVAPALWMAPPSLIEGSAVASEGRNGSGRAGDPLVAAAIRQDRLEGRFKDFWQAAGAWDDYPFGSLPYDYGGWFCSWLLRRDGEERFAELWQRLGEGNILGGLEGPAWAGGAFRAVYGRGLEEAWEEFRASLALRGPVVMETVRLTGPSRITALAAGRGMLVWADAAAGAVMVADAGGRGARVLFAADGNVERLDVSPDGGSLLVSWARGRGGVVRPVVLTWDFAAARFVAEAEGLREAAFAASSGSILALSGSGFRADLVLVSPSGTRVLLRGGDTRAYSQPASPDGRMVYCLAREGGRVLLIRLDLESGAAETLVPGAPLEHLRSLSLAPAGGGEPRLALSWAPEQGLYRSAILVDGQPPLLGTQDVDISGSVLSPVIGEGGRVFYIGSFSGGQALCAWPEAGAATALRPGQAAWAALDPSFQSPGGSAGPSAGPAAGPAPRATLSSTGETPATVRKAPPLPLALRTVRLPTLSTDLDAAGITLFGEDIAGRLAWELDAQYAWDAQAANLGLALVAGLRPWRASLRLSDIFTAGGAGTWLRTSGAILELSRPWTFLPARRVLDLSLRVAGAGLAPAAPGSAYAEPWSLGGAAAGARLGYASWKTAWFPPWPRSGGALALAGDAEWGLGAGGSRPGLSLDAEAEAAAPFLGLELAARASWSPDGSVLFGARSRRLSGGGGGRPSILAPRHPAYEEYAALAAWGGAAAFGEASILLLNDEIQSRLAAGALAFPLYFQRLTARAGLRASLLSGSPAPAQGELFLSSAFLRVELSGSPLAGAAARLRLAASLEGSWAFRPDLAGQAARIALLLGARL